MALHEVVQKWFNNPAQNSARLVFVQIASAWPAAVIAHRHGLIGYVFFFDSSWTLLERTQRHVSPEYVPGTEWGGEPCPRRRGAPPFRLSGRTVRASEVEPRRAGTVADKEATVEARS